MKHRSMCITYEVEGSLYVNVTNRCSNRCTFCIRNNGDGAYGSDSLWLEREPTVDEITESILSRDVPRYPEIVFCGYGEPSYRLADICTVAKRVKQKHPGVRIRINTNGQSDLILGCNSAPLYKDAFDSVSISLNAPNAREYAGICLPIYGEAAFESILGFAGEVIKYVPDTRFSVVGEFLSPESLEECKRLSREISVPLRIREYIGPD